MKKIVAVFLLTILSTCIFAQTSKIERVWVTYDEHENGEKGMRIHVKFTVDGMLNRQGNVNAWFYNSDGSRLRDTNNNYKTSDGQVATHLSYKHGYANAIYEDFRIFMPYKELDLANGTHSLKFDIGIFDNNSKQLIVSENHYFTATVSSSRQNCFSCATLGYKLCSNCYGTGLVQQFSFGQIYYFVCAYCSGLGKITCGSCNGNGYIVNFSGTAFDGRIPEKLALPASIKAGMTLNEVKNIYPGGDTKTDVDGNIQYTKNLDTGNTMFRYDFRFYPDEKGLRCLIIYTSEFTFSSAYNIFKNADDRQPVLREDGTYIWVAPSYYKIIGFSLEDHKTYISIQYTLRL